MAFKLDDIIVDRIQMAVAEDSEGKLLYTLTQLSDATIEISAESKDATDATGTLVKRFWQGKSGTFTATNAMLNLNVIGEASGEGKVAVTQMPKIVTVNKGTATISIAGYVADTVVVNAMSNNGAMGKAYESGATASVTKFTVAEDGTLTLPTDSDAEKFVVKYMRTVTEDNAVAIKNKADKFPQTVKLTLKALIVDPCESDVLRSAYIVLPSFQVSPEVSIELTTEANLDYTGDLQVDYCSADKTLYEIYICSDDEEE